MDNPTTAAAKGQPEQVEVQVNLHYPAGLAPAGISFVGLSRLGADVQLDLGYVNLHRLVQQLNDPETTAKVADVQVVFSAHLTPSAFLKLHSDVNVFYDQMKAAGVIK